MKTSLTNMTTGQEMTFVGPHFLRSGVRFFYENIRLKIPQGYYDVLTCIRGQDRIHLRGWGTVCDFTTHIRRVDDPPPPPACSGWPTEDEHELHRILKSC